MKLRVWLNCFLIFYCVALLVFMFSTDERPFWYDVASFLPVIVLSAQSWYYWRKEQKIENVDDNEIKALLKDGQKKEAILKIREDGQCGLLSAIIYVRELEKTSLKD